MAHLAHYKEAHPLPFVITHWVNLICMFVLILTGLYIHYPLFPWFMSVARGLHIFCGIVILVNLIVRIILAFKVKSAPTGGTRELVMDYKTWLPQKDNRHMWLEWIKYYTFLQKEHPLSAKLGNPQKMAYLCVPLLILAMGFTGLCLWIPTSSLLPFVAFTQMLGGLMAVRIVHVILMFVLIIFTLIHLYLVFVEGLGPAKLMLFHKESPGLVYSPEKHTIVGKDTMEHNAKPQE